MATAHEKLGEYDKALSVLKSMGSPTEGNKMVMSLKEGVLHAFSNSPHDAIKILEVVVNTETLPPKKRVDTYLKLGILYEAVENH